MQLFLSATEAWQLRAPCLPNFCTKWFSTLLSNIHALFCISSFKVLQGEVITLMHWYCFYKACKLKADLPHISMPPSYSEWIYHLCSAFQVWSSVVNICVVVPITLLVWDISHNEFVSSKRCFFVFPLWRRPCLFKSAYWPEQASSLELLFMFKFY